MAYSWLRTIFATWDPEPIHCLRFSPALKLPMKRCLSILVRRPQAFSYQITIKVIPILEQIDDLKPLFNSVSGSESWKEWLSNMDSYIDLPAGSVLNHCLYHCLYEEAVCDIVVFESGRCHFGQLDGPNNATEAQLLDSVGPWDLYFSPPFRTWYFGNETWNPAFTSVGPRMSKHFFRLLYTSIEEMCAIDCNFHTQHSSPCSFYAYDNVTQKCYLGSLNDTSNMFGEITWENKTVKSLAGKLNAYANKARFLFTKKKLVLPRSKDVGSESFYECSNQRVPHQ